MRMRTCLVIGIVVISVLIFGIFHLARLSSPAESDSFVVSSELPYVTKPIYEIQGESGKIAVSAGMVLAVDGRNYGFVSKGDSVRVVTLESGWKRVFVNNKRRMAGGIQD